MLKYVGGTFSPRAAAERVSFMDHMAGTPSAALLRRMIAKTLTERDT